MKINKKPPQIPTNPDSGPRINPYVIAGIASGKDGSLIGVFGASEFAHGVKGICKNNDLAGVLGQNDYPDGIGISGTADNGIGVHGTGRRLAGLFEGDVSITGDLTVRGVRIQLLLQRIQYLEQQVSQINGAAGAAELKASQAEQRAIQAEQRASQAEYKSRQAEDKASEVQRNLDNQATRLGLKMEAIEGSIRQLTLAMHTHGS